MVRDDVQFALEYVFMAEPFAYVPHIAFEVEVRVAQFDTRVGNDHLLIGIAEVDSRNDHRLRQSFGHMQFSVLQFDFQARVPLEEYVLSFAVVSRTDVHVERSGHSSELFSHPHVRQGCLEFSSKARSGLVFLTTAE